MDATRWAHSQPVLKATWIAMRIAGKVSEALGGLLAARLWFTPWHVELSQRAAAREAAWLEGTESFDVPAAGMRLCGFTAGEGPAVLLVHGWGERASALGAFIRPLTERGFRVIGVDLPGHGRSPAGQTNALVVAAALHDVAARYGPLHAVIAHSMGAHATALALRDGMAARRAVMLAPSVRLDHALEKFSQMFAVPPKATAGLRKTIERRFGRSVWDELAAERLVASLHVRALVIHDEEDPQVDHSDAELLVDAWPGATLQVTKGLGHLRIVRDSKVIDAVMDFVEEDASRRIA